MLFLEEKQEGGPIQVSGVRGAAGQARAAVSARLQARRAELEQVALARISAVSEAGETTSPDYVEGLRAAVLSALDYGLASIERDAEQPPPVPAALLQQARLAARNGVALHTVLRRYFAGYTLLGEFLIDEANNGEAMPSGVLQQVLRGQAILFDRLVAVITDEYRREQAERLDTLEQRRAKQIEALLAGRLVGPGGLDYDFEANHIGVIAVGHGSDGVIREVGASLDYRALLVHREEATVWAWLGARRDVDPVAFEQLVSYSWPEQLTVSIGEPGHGIAGWRLSHQQARAALPVALCSSSRITRYAEVALIAAALGDEVLAASLHQLYLVPLTEERDGGKALRETLRAYYAAEGNISSTAAILGISRQTVVNRLRMAEERIGRRLGGCLAEIDVAFQVRDLGLQVDRRPRQ